MRCNNQKYYPKKVLLGIEAIGKMWCNNQKYYPKNVLPGKETITNSKLIAGNFNNVFTKIGLKFASEIEKSAKTFDVCLKYVDILQSK